MNKNLKSMKLCFILEILLLSSVNILALLFLNSIYIKIGMAIYIFVIFYFIIFPFTRKKTDEEMRFFLGRLYDKSYLTEIGTQIAIMIVFYLLSLLWSLFFFAVGFHLLWIFALLIEMVSKWCYFKYYKEDNLSEEKFDDKLK
jgi:hypothetical protein